MTVNTQDCLFLHSLVCSKRYSRQNFWVTRALCQFKLTSVHDLASTVMKVSAGKLKKQEMRTNP